MTFDPKSLFDEDFTIFFDGPPDVDKLEPGQLGVNIDLFNQVRSHYRRSQNNMSLRILADICQDIKTDGFIGLMEDSALRLSAAGTTVQRWRNRFQETGLLIQEGKYNRYAVDPKVAVRMDDKGNPVLPDPNKSDVFTF